MTTDFKNYCLKICHRFLRKDPFIKDFFGAVNVALQGLENNTEIIKQQFFFNTLNEQGCRYFETLLKIKPTASQTITNRQDAIRAKWRSSGHNSITLIQNVCESWKNGEVIADFTDGKLKLTFIGEYGVPEDLQALLNAINEIKPAHIPFEVIFKYLLIENIQEIKTIEEMENLTIKQFYFGRE